MHIDAILREGDVDSRGNFNFSVVLSPLPLMMGGPLQIQDQPPWGPIQVLSIALICPVVDEVIQGGEGRVVGKDQIERELISFFKVSPGAPMEESPFEEGAARKGP